MITDLVGGDCGWLRWWLVVEVDVDVDVVMLGMLGTVVDMGGFREDVGCVM